MTAILDRIKKWFSEPQDIIGLATWAYTVSLSVSQYMTAHSVSLPTLIGGAVAGLVAVFVPTGSAIPADAAKLATDLATGVTAKDAAIAPAVLADAAKIVEDAEKPATK